MVPANLRAAGDAAPATAPTRLPTAPPRPTYPAPRLGARPHERSERFLIGTKRNFRSELTPASFATMPASSPLHRRTGPEARPHRVGIHRNLHTPVAGTGDQRAAPSSISPSSGALSLAFSPRVPSRSKGTSGIIGQRTRAPGAAAASGELMIRIRRRSPEPEGTDEPLAELGLELSAARCQPPHVRRRPQFARAAPGRVDGGRQGQRQPPARGAGDGKSAQIPLSTHKDGHTWGRQATHRTSNFGSSSGHFAAAAQHAHASRYRRLNGPLPDAAPGSAPPRPVAAALASGRGAPHRAVRARRASRRRWRYGSARHGS